VAWTAQSVPGTGFLRDVWSPGGGKLFALDSFTGIYVRDAGQWSVAPLG
jgi:hypothetical protein